jgi:hypothetical protein
VAFASAITDTGYIGNLRYAYGTYTNGVGDTGGDIDTGLDSVFFAALQPNAAATVAAQHVVNDTLPVAGNALTIVTGDGEDGYWFAIGR